MPGLLLDTNALIWFVAGEPMTDEALVAIAMAQDGGGLFVSPVSAWEAALAVRKSNANKRPNLGGREAAPWFAYARRLTGAKLAPVTHRIALEAARVPAVYGRGDPGDCFIIATARVRRLRVVTRDGPMSELAANEPAYLSLVQC
jgi:PIN domain nuclease of toxin-antitoxin system